MFRHLHVVLTLVCLVAPQAQAGESHNAGIGYSNSALVKNNLRAGRVAIEVFAPDYVDVASLVADLDLSKSISAQSIAGMVNERRQLLYPDEEIILSIAPPPGADAAAGAQEKASLVKAVYWWNNTNCSTCYWYAQYSSSVATLFVDDVQYGAYNVYDKVGSGSWVYRYRTSAGGASTMYSVGSKVMRGFKGASNGVASKADVIMYFFK